MGNTPIPSAPLNAVPPEEGLVSKFGRIVQAVRKILGSETEQPPLQTTFGTDAEARGFGGSGTVNPDQRTMAAWAYEKMRVEAGRIAAYRDYEVMDAEQTEVCAALDVLAEFSTQGDEAEDTFEIDTQNQALKDRLNAYVKQLGLKEKVTPAAREIFKYGSAYWELVVDETGQPVAVRPLNPTTMKRNEDAYGRLETTAFTQLDMSDGKDVAKFASWQITHFRYQKSFSRIYGNSTLESPRKVWKQLALCEDGMVVGRLYRSHVRFAFHIPVDGMTSEQAKEYLEELKTKNRKKMRFDPTTGQMQTYETPMSAEEDFWIPTRKENPGKVEVLQGQSDLGQISDVEYLQNKLLTALGVPKGALGYERDLNSKATLTEQNVSFARKLRRVQQVLATGIHEVLRRCLILEGVDVDNLEEWKVAFPVISSKDQTAQWQIEALKATVISMYVRMGLLDKDYIYTNILELQPEEIAKIKKALADPKNVPQMAQPPAPVPGSGVPSSGGSGAGSGGGNPQQTFPQPSAHELRIVGRMRELVDYPGEGDARPEELQIARAFRTIRDLSEDIEIPFEELLIDGLREIPTYRRARATR